MASTATAADFHAIFTSQKRQIEELLARPSPPLTEVSEALTALKRGYNAVVGGLPSYDRRGCDLALKDLESRLGALRAKDRPKAKFSFAKKPSSSVKALVPQVQTAPSLSTQPTPSATAPPKDEEPIQPIPPVQSNTHHLSNIANRLINPTTLSADLPKLKGEYTLSLEGISNCVIDLRSGSSSRTIGNGSVGDTATGTVDGVTGGHTDPRATLKSIHVNGLDRCVLVTDWMNGSAMLHGCTDSILILGAHQFRMHTSNECKVYLHVTSSPIIEHCKTISFAPYPSSLSTSDAPNRLTELADFDWVRPGPSPNWRMMSSIEEEHGEVVLALLNSDMGAEEVLERAIGPAA